MALNKTFVGKNGDFRKFWSQDVGNDGRYNLGYY